MYICDVWEDTKTGDGGEYVERLYFVEDDPNLGTNLRTLMDKGLHLNIRKTLPNETIHLEPGAMIQ